MWLHLVYLGQQVKFEKFTLKKITVLLSKDAKTYKDKMLLCTPDYTSPDIEKQVAEKQEAFPYEVHFPLRMEEDGWRDGWREG